MATADALMLAEVEDNSAGSYSEPDSEEMLAEADQLLREARAQGEAVYQKAERESVGYLLRSVHSYKSLMAFAGRQSQSSLAGEFERYLKALWQGQIPIDRDAQTIVRRGLSLLQKQHLGDRADLDASAAQLVEQLRSRVQAARIDPSPLVVKTPIGVLEGPDSSPETVAEPTAQLTTAELAEMAQMSGNLNRLLYRLRDSLPTGDDRVEALIAALLVTGEKLHQTLHRHRFVSLRMYLLPAVGAVREMATSQGKLATARLDVSSVEVDRPLLQALRPSLLHLLRNAVAHGIEPPEGRVAAGKPEMGTIIIGGAVRDGWLHLSVKDDGRGFDVTALRSAAVAAGAVSPERAASDSDSQAAFYALIPGLTTKKDPDALSGNGVGLTVVAENVHALGGTLKLDSHLGHYSVVHLSVPLPSATTPPSTVL